jgi:hypothetical protein
MPYGGLSARVSRLESKGIGECQACQGRAGAASVFVDRGDGVCRDVDGRVAPTGPDEWTCSVCGSTYCRPRVVIQVVGRAKTRPG